LQCTSRASSQPLPEERGAQLGKIQSNKFCTSTTPRSSLNVLCYPLLRSGHVTFCAEVMSMKHSRVSFSDGSFYDDSVLRPLSSRTVHSRLVVHHCRNSTVLSLLSALPALFRCACVSSFLFYCSCFKLIVIFPPTTSIKRQERKSQNS